MDIAPLAFVVLLESGTQVLLLCPRSSRCSRGNISPSHDVTLLKDACYVFGSVREQDSSLARDARIYSLHLGRYRYGSWTQNCSHDLSHADGTPDAARVATRHHHRGGTCPPSPDYLTRGRWHTADRRRRHCW